MLAGRTAVITGGAQSIGLAIAARFATTVDLPSYMTGTVAEVTGWRYM